MRITIARSIFCAATALIATGVCGVVTGQAREAFPPLVPGTGVQIEGAADDFEDPEWKFDMNLPKVYNRGDTNLAVNEPLGRAANFRWHEGKKRGGPDEVRRVATPAGGLPGSTGAMAFRSIVTGGPAPTRQQQQDDLIFEMPRDWARLSVSKAPSVVVRVWLPPIDQWERRSGCHFAFRLSLETNRPQSMGRFRQAAFSSEDATYWPGMFLNREIGQDPATGEPTERVYFWMKATEDGRLLPGPELEMTGWWTLGMSVTPDGKVHYYGKPGVDDLTEADHIASSYPFGKRAVTFRTWFLNVCNGDDGRTWSTEFIVDDPAVYVAR